MSGHDTALAFLAAVGAGFMLYALWLARRIKQIDAKLEKYEALMRAEEQVSRKTSPAE